MKKSSPAIVALAVGPLRDERGAEGQQDGRQVGGRVAVGDRAADGAAVAHLRVADLAGGVGEQRDLLRRAGRSISRSRWRVSAPMATWSPPSRM